MDTLRHVIRVALLAVIAFGLLAVVIGVAASETGVAEKVLLAAGGMLLLWAASWVRRHAV